MAIISRVMGAEEELLPPTGVTTGTNSLDIDLETNGYEGTHVTVDANFPASPTDNLIVEVYSSIDSTNYDDTPIFSMHINNGTDPNQISFILKDVMHAIIHVKRDGTTDTITVTITHQPWRWQSV